MKLKRIVVEDDMSVVTMDIDDDEIPAMLDSGYVSAVLSVTNDGVEYAKVDWDEYTVEWVEPEHKVFE